MKRLCLFAFVAVAGFAGAGRAQVNFNVYGDADYFVSKRGQTANSFAVPALDFFPSGAAGRFSFLAEVVFEAGTDNNFTVDLERMEIAWIFGDWLRVHAGRFHTAIGYYNDAFHHGVYFQLPIERPGFVNFEDSGGLIPAHSVGLHLDGRLPAGSVGSIRYDLEIANTRGLVVDNVQNRQDVALPKAVNLRLRFEPAFLPGLVFGANALFDHIPANGNPALAAGPIPEMNEWIFGAHAAYQEGPVRFIAEGAVFLHGSRTDARSFASEAGLVELGYAFGDFTPYALLERVSLDTGDPFFANSAAAVLGSHTSLRAGLKMNVSDHLALKGEAGHILADAGADTNAIAVQAAFAF